MLFVAGAAVPRSWRSAPACWAVRDRDDRCLGSDHRDPIEVRAGTPAGEHRSRREHGPEGGSDRPGGLGGEDIYLTTRGPDGRWAAWSTLVPLSMAP